MEQTAHHIHSRIRTGSICRRRHSTSSRMRRSWEGLCSGQKARVKLSWEGSLSQRSQCLAIAWVHRHQAWTQRQLRMAAPAVQCMTRSLLNLGAAAQPPCAIREFYSQQDLSPPTESVVHWRPAAQHVVEKAGPAGSVTQTDCGGPAPQKKFQLRARSRRSPALGGMLMPPPWSGCDRDQLHRGMPCCRDVWCQLSQQCSCGEASVKQKTLTHAQRFTHVSRR